MRDWLRTLLFVSAFSPALLSLACVKYFTHGYSIEILQLSCIGAIGATLPFLILRLIRAKGERFHVKVEKIKSNDFIFLIFIASYLLPFVSNGIDVSIGGIFIILVIIFWALWMISSLPVHPLLRIFRYKFYEVELSDGSTYILLSRRIIRAARSVQLVRQISRNMILEENTDV